MILTAVSVDGLPFSEGRGLSNRSFSLRETSSPTMVVVEKRAVLANNHQMSEWREREKRESGVGDRYSAGSHNYLHGDRECGASLEVVLSEWGEFGSVWFCERVPRTCSVWFDKGGMEKGTESYRCISSKFEKINIIYIIFTELLLLL